MTEILISGSKSIQMLYTITVFCLNYKATNRTEKMKGNDFKHLSLGHFSFLLYGKLEKKLFASSVLLRVPCVV